MASTDRGHRSHVFQGPRSASPAALRPIQLVHAGLQQSGQTYPFFMTFAVSWGFFSWPLLAHNFYCGSFFAQNHETVCGFCWEHFKSSGKSFWLQGCTSLQKLSPHRLKVQPWKLLKCVRSSAFLSLTRVSACAGFCSVSAVLRAGSYPFSDHFSACFSGMAVFLQFCSADFCFRTRHFLSHAAVLEVFVRSSWLHPAFVALKRRSRIVVTGDWVCPACHCKARGKYTLYMYKAKNLLLCSQHTPFVLLQQ